MQDIVKKDYHSRLKPTVHARGVENNNIISYIRARNERVQRYV